MDLAKYFQRDPEICGGETVIAGTRVTLRTVLASLGEGFAQLLHSRLRQQRKTYRCWQRQFSSEAQTR